MMRTRHLLLITMLAGGVGQPAVSEEAKKPNVVIVITDDQGYGDPAYGRVPPQANKKRTKVIE